MEVGSIFLLLFRPRTERVDESFPAMSAVTRVTTIEAPRSQTMTPFSTPNSNCLTIAVWRFADPREDVGVRLGVVWGGKLPARGLDDGPGSWTFRDSPATGRSAPSMNSRRLERSEA